MKKTPLHKNGKSSMSKAKRKAWSAFSLYIRISASDINGNAKCVTCGAVKSYKDLQAGHFIPGRRNAVLFSEEGVHPQCYHCNIGLNGNWPGGEALCSQLPCVASAYKNSDRIFL